MYYIYEENKHVTLVEHYEKRTTVVFPLRFLWSPCSAISKQLHMCFSWFTNWHFRYVGACNIPFEKSWKHLSNGISHAPEYSILQLQNAFSFFCSRLVTVYQCGQKEPQWENNYGSFSHSFLLVLVSWEKQSCSYLATANHDGQKNRNGKTTVVLFRIVLYYRSTIAGSCT